MQHIGKIELMQWIQKVYELNAEYHERIDLDVKQILAPPASEKELEEFEVQLGYRLPPSYRLFLSLHNGWQHWEGDTDLISIAERQHGEYAEHIRILKEDAWEAGHAAVVEGLFIGLNLDSSGAFILDTQKIDKRGEMEIINYEYDEIARYSDFLDMLKKTAKNLEEIIAEEGKDKNTE